ncbi:TrkH-domain-containing protein [Backusella circina FSU 941]|nr:TrkH-domain-containing protein [Backusella circina FSU 941]
MRLQFAYFWASIKWYYNEKIHFLQLHYIYIFLIAFVISSFFYFEPHTDWAFIDALFMGTSVATNTGLNTINMSALSTWQIVSMYFGSFFGSHVMVSIIVLYVRRHFFSKRFEDVLVFNKAQRLKEENRLRFEKNLTDVEKIKNKRHSKIFSPSAMRRRMSFLSMQSSPELKDEEKGEDEPKRKIRPLSTNFANLDILSHFKKNSSNAENDPSDITRIETNEQSMESSTNNDDILPSHPDDDGDDDDSDVKSPPDRRFSLMSAPNRVRLSKRTNSILLYPTDSQDSTMSPVNTRETAVQSLDDDDSLPSVFGDDDDESKRDGNHQAGTSHGIAFADNIERQRELARRHLEQDRKFDEILQRIACDNDSTVVDHEESRNVEEENEEMKRIMREPIHKHELTRQQRYRLGGAEYRALDFLTILVPVYYILFGVGCGFVIRIYVAASSYAREVLNTSNGEPVNYWTYSFFCSLSAFNNLGLIPLDASMTPFQEAPCMLIITMILILAGNTAYALLLRLTIWILYKITPKKYIMRRETFRYLLDHPRRCYTTLFPSTQTKWLFIVLLAITLVEFITLLCLNYWLPVLESLDWGAKVLDSLFQSIATRNAGFSVIDLSMLNPGSQIVFIVAMYISVYPVAISMRNSNVYQERDLGIYKGESDDNDDDNNNTSAEHSGGGLVHRLKRHSTMTSVVTTSKKVLRKPDFFVMTQIQRQLTSEICWVICCIFTICVIEAEAIMSVSPITISSVMYECVSAFGNVGASLGYPNMSTSQAGQYRTLSKLVLIILMYRGRHRGLPAAIDRAVLLPSEQLEEKEHQDHLLKRRNTSLSFNDGGEAGGVMFYTRSRTL